MILSFGATAFAVIGILLTLLTALTLGFYFGSVPSGSNAMGLVVPFFAAVWPAWLPVPLLLLGADWTGSDFPDRRQWR